MGLSNGVRQYLTNLVQNNAIIFRKNIVLERSQTDESSGETVPLDGIAEHLFIDLNYLIHKVVRRLEKNLRCIKDSVIRFKAEEHYMREYKLTYGHDFFSVDERLLFEEESLNKIWRRLRTELLKWLNRIQPTKSIGFFMDGVAPIVKMATQFERRNVDKSKKLSLAVAISPGTEMMVFLEEKLVMFAKELCHIGYKHLFVHISGSEVVGEGETKLIKEVLQPYYDPNDTFAIVSPDSDMVIMCLCTFRKNIFLFQELDVYRVLDINLLANQIIKMAESNTVERERTIIDFVFICLLHGHDYLYGTGGFESGFYKNSSKYFKFIRNESIYANRYLIKFNRHNPNTNSCSIELDLELFALLTSTVKNFQQLLENVIGGKESIEKGEAGFHFLHTNLWMMYNVLLGECPNWTHPFIGHHYNVEETLAYIYRHREQLSCAEGFNNLRYDFSKNVLIYNIGEVEPHPLVPCTALLSICPMRYFSILPIPLLSYISRKREFIDELDKARGLNKVNAIIRLSQDEELKDFLTDTSQFIGWEHKTIRNLAKGTVYYNAAEITNISEILQKDKLNVSCKKVRLYRRRGKWYDNHYSNASNRKFKTSNRKFKASRKQNVSKFSNNKYSKKQPMVQLNNATERKRKREETTQWQTSKKPVHIKFTQPIQPRLSD
jgi:hypothetical protein